MPMLLAIAALLGCAPQRGTLQPVVEARAAELADLASPDARVVAAAGGLVAAVCGYDLPFWREESGGALALEPELMALLGLPDGGEVLHDGATGEVLVRWPSATPYAGEDSIVTLEVSRAGEAYVLTIVPQEGSASMATVRASVEACGEQATLTLSASLPDDAEARLPFGEGLATWSLDGDPLPQSGALRWAVDSGVVISEDASLIEGVTWPAEASHQDWSWPVELALDAE
ncbi:MAG: hypothetical protein H6740_11085 [Alphaproteobacteria bacterium]|nr:hypothetical protein [Alphaproteobacteria bacterium]